MFSFIKAQINYESKICTLLFKMLLNLLIWAKEKLIYIKNFLRLPCMLLFTLQDRWCVLLRAPFQGLKIYFVYDPNKMANYFNLFFLSYSTVNMN